MCRIADHQNPPPVPRRWEQERVHRPMIDGIRIVHIGAHIRHHVAAEISEQILKDQMQPFARDTPSLFHLFND